MVVKLRLMRRGRCGVPVYWMVAAESSVKRDGNFLVKFGTYMPLNDKESKVNVINESKLQFYLNNGAEPTETVLRLLNNYYSTSKEHEDIKTRLNRYVKRSDRWAKSVSA